ncbi:MAG: FHA domain-containing serine/threonine-protein kinase [Planctomycetaceae bacterium]
MADIEQTVAKQIDRPEAVGASAGEIGSDGRHVNVVIGDYECLDLLGQGGMGTVWRARHRTLGRTVALKLLRRDRMHDDDAVARFHREIAALGRLPPHPNVVVATDARCIDRQSVLVMEFCEGQDLSRIVKHTGGLPVKDACELIRQIAAGLMHIANHGLVHRDLKPSNVLLTNDGVVRILDLGMAKIIPRTMEVLTELTCEGQALGTPDFMAPEQWRDSRHVDIRTDLYSLGCTLHFLLAGKAPFRVTADESPLFKQHAHLNAPIPDLNAVRNDVPDDVQKLIHELMAKSINDRPAGPQQVIARLDRWARGANLSRLVKRFEAASVPPRVITSGAFADTVLGNVESRLEISVDEPVKSAALAETSVGSLRLQISGTPFIYTAPSDATMVTVGRQRRRVGSTDSEGCDLVIRLAPDDKRVLRISRRHFRIRCYGARFLLSDLSQFGTRVNGQTVPHGQEVELIVGDRIQVADLVELCVLPSQPTQSLVDVSGPVVCDVLNDLRHVMFEVSLGDLKTVEPADDCL